MATLVSRSLPRLRSLVLLSRCGLPGISRCQWQSTASKSNQSLSEWVLPFYNTSFISQSPMFDCLLKAILEVCGCTVCICDHFTTSKHTYYSESTFWVHFIPLGVYILKVKHKNKLLFIKFKGYVRSTLVQNLKPAGLVNFIFLQ